MNRKLTTLIIITLVLVVFAVVAVKQENASVSNSEAGKALFAGFKDKINDVAVIEAKHGKQTVTVELKDNHWEVKEKDGYDANLGKVKRTILGIADMNLVEPKTRKKANYDKLQVEDPADDKSKSTLVTLKDDKNRVLASVILGKVKSSFSHPESSSMYVRKANDPQAWQVTGELHADATANDWLDDSLLNIQPSRVQRIIVTPAQGRPYTVEKAEQKGDHPGQQHYVLADLPRGKVMKSASVADGMARVVSGLRLLDVQKAASFDPGKDMDDKKQAKKAVFQTIDGMVIDAELHKQYNNTYMILSASFDPALRPAPADDSLDKNADDKKSAKTGTADKKPDTAKPAATQTPKLEELAAVQQQVSELNDRLKGWVFRVADSKVSALNKSAADLLQDANAKAAATARPNLKHATRH